MKNYTGFKRGMITGISFSKRENNKTYWLLRCDCGNEVIKDTKVFFKSSTTISCGCLRKGQGINPAVSSKISAYKKGAKERGLIYNLSNDFFEKITSSNCFYCGVIPSQLSKRNGHEYFYNGIDRVNNSIGYIEENVVPCCVFCNKAKRDLDIEVFTKWVKRLSEYQNSLIKK